MVIFLIGITLDCISNVELKDKGEISVKTKMKKFFAASVKTILNLIWTVGANLLASALLA